MYAYFWDFVGTQSNARFHHTRELLPQSRELREENALARGIRCGGSFASGHREPPSLSHSLSRTSQVLVVSSFFSFLFFLSLSIVSSSRCLSLFREIVGDVNPFFCYHHRLICRGLHGLDLLPSTIAPHPIFFSVYCSSVEWMTAIAVLFSSSRFKLLKFPDCLNMVGLRSLYLR